MCLRTIEHYFGDDAVKYYRAGELTDLVDAIEGAIPCAAEMQRDSIERPPNDLFF
jgi:hypothetical protein